MQKNQVGMDNLRERIELVATDAPVRALLGELEAAPELWDEITARQTTPGSAHADTEAIFVRWPADQSVWAAFYDLTCVDRMTVIPKLAGGLSDILARMLPMIGVDPATADIGRLLIVRLKPGGKVTPHVDTGPYADKYDRFHVVLQCEDGDDVLLVDRQAYVCSPGDVLWMNHKRIHEAWNLSATVPRIHLIVDVVAPEYRAKRGLCFQQERAVDIWEEALPLFQLHKNEIAHYQDVALAINTQFYENADAMGVLRVFTARQNGQLVGYSVFIVQAHPHYKGLHQAVNDVLFVHPDHRHGGVGVQLTSWCESMLKAEGVMAVMQHIKLKSKPTIKLFEHLGYEPIDIIMGKRLDR